MDKRKIISLLRMYFLRGYREWICLPIAIIQFSVIVYNLTILKEALPNVFVFILVFIPALSSISIIVGKLDYSQGTYPEEQKKIGELNPLWNRMFKELKEIRKKLDG